MTPRDVGACSIWEMDAAITGWARANSADTNDGDMSDAEADALWEMVKDG